MMKQKKSQKQQSDSKTAIAPLLTETELSISQIRNIQMATNNTFVGCKWEEQTYSAILLHFGEDGQTIQQLKVETYNNYYSLISPCQLLFSTYSWQTGLHHLCVWNLETKSVTKAVLDEADRFSKLTSTQYIVFYQTKIFCQVTTCKEKDNCKIVLKFYNLPLKSGQKHFHSYTYKQYQDKNEMKVKKLNNRNLLAFLPSKFDVDQQHLLFDAYQVCTDVEKNEGKLIPVRIKHGFKNAIEDTNLLARISDMWQIEANNFYVQLEIYVDIYHLYKNRGRDIEKSLVQKLSKQEKYVNFYWDQTTNELTEMKFNIGVPHRIQFTNAVRNLQDLSEKQSWALTKRLAKLNTRHRSEKQSYVRVPIYYFNILTEQVFAVHKVTPKDEQHTYCWPQYDPDCRKMLQYWIENKNQPSQETIIQIRKLPSPYDSKIVFAFFLFQFVETCDQDLVNEAVALIN